MLNRPLAVLAAAVTLGATAVALAPAASADPAVAGTYNALTVQRIVNTTTGVGAAKKALAPGQTLTVEGLAGLGGQSVSALNLTVTAISPTRNGYLTAYSGTTRPGVATVTFTAGESTPNNAAVSVDADGSLKIYNGSPGTVDLSLDRNGYWTGGTPDANDYGVYQPRTPARVADSRTGKTPLAAGKAAAIPLDALDLPASAIAVVANIGAVAPTSNGYAAAFDADDVDDPSAAPGTTTVSFTKGRSRTNLTATYIDGDGAISLFNGSTTPLNYTVDVVGYYTASTTDETGGTDRDGSTDFFQQRLADSRAPGAGGPIASRATRVVDLGAPAGVTTATLSITASGASASGFLTAWNGVSARPNSSVTNFYANSSRTGTLAVPVRYDADTGTGTITLYNGSTKPVSYTIDIVGYTYTPTATPMKAAKARTTWATGTRHVR